MSTCTCQPNPNANLTCLSCFLHLCHSPFNLIYTFMSHTHFNFFKPYLSCMFVTSSTCTFQSHVSSHVSHLFLACYTLQSIARAPFTLVLHVCHIFLLHLSLHVHSHFLHLCLPCPQSQLLHHLYNLSSMFIARSSLHLSNPCLLKYLTPLSCSLACLYGTLQPTLTPNFTYLVCFHTFILYLSIS